LVRKGPEPLTDRIPLHEALPDLPAASGARDLRIDVAWVPAGPFLPERVARVPGAVVVLVSGLVARTMSLEDGSAAELLGAGALLAPPGAGEQEQLLGLPGYHVRFEALETSRVGIVGRDLLAGLAEQPELVKALLGGRGRQDAERAAMHAICRLTGVDRRLLALFRLLAARHGRPTPDGIAVPVAIPHRLLAELIGARRPTVTTALRSLRLSGELRRLDDGTWLLRADAPSRSFAPLDDAEARPPAGVGIQPVA
jgi:CRP/FNR family transcriptional regulator, cyclic AMP receptor protein